MTWASPALAGLISPAHRRVLRNHFIGNALLPGTSLWVVVVAREAMIATADPPEASRKRLARRGPADVGMRSAGHMRMIARSDQGLKSDGECRGSRYYTEQDTMCIQSLGQPFNARICLPRQLQDPWCRYGNGYRRYGVSSVTVFKTRRPSGNDQRIGRRGVRTRRQIPDPRRRDS